jgi:hypothetical protein
MNEDEKRVWDVRIGILAPMLTACGTIAALLVGVWQFQAGQHNEATLEFHRQLFLQRITAYQQIAGIAGQIAVATDRKQIKTLANRFDADYWGMVTLVEDKQVADAMQSFHEELHDYVRGSAWTSADMIKKKAYALAMACRNSVNDARESGLQ